MSSFSRRLDRWWFEVVSPVRLGVIRLLTGLFSMWYISRNGLWLDHYVDKEPDIFKPIGLATLLDGPLAADVVVGLGVATTVFGVLYILGLWWRVAGPVYSALLLFTLTYKNSWGMLFHTENMMILHIMVLGFMPSARAFAVDPLIRQRFQAPVLGWLGFSPGSTEPHWLNGGVIRMLQLVVTLSYVLAGLAKIMGPSGWSWALGDNLRDQVGMNGIWYAMTKGSAQEITYSIYSWDWPWTAMAATALLLELFAPLAMISRRTGYLGAASFWGLHYGIYLVMGIAFKYQLSGAAYLCFFPWERLPAGVRRLRHSVVQRVTGRKASAEVAQSEE